MNHADVRQLATVSADAAWTALHAAACVPFRTPGAGPGWQFASHFARGKLGRDPVFRALLERGDLRRGGRVVDIGCGQGVLAGLLQACNDAAWPAAWPQPPRTTAYTGIELMPRDVARAERALSQLPLAPRFVCADMRDAAIPPCDIAVLLDVLHYVDHAAQRALLLRVLGALLPRGRLLLRVCDAARPRAYRLSQWVDRAVALARGHGLAPTWGRTVADWQALLVDIGFTTTALLPMRAGTPFPNTLIVAELNEPSRSPRSLPPEGALRPFGTAGQA